MANEDVLLAALQGVQGQLSSMDQRFQASVSKLEVEQTKQGETLAKLTATWKDKAVTQIGAIALAALSIIGAQRALAKDPPPQRTVVQQTELQIRADGCSKMANGNDDEYAHCMAREVVAPNAPSSREAIERH
jgi:hypothetical protein